MEEGNKIGSVGRVLTKKCPYLLDGPGDSASGDATWNNETTDIKHKNIK